MNNGTILSNLKLELHYLIKCQITGEGEISRVVCYIAMKININDLCLNVKHKKGISRQWSGKGAIRKKCQLQKPVGKKLNWQLDTFT